MTKIDFYGQAESFLQHLFAQMDQNGVELKPHWSIDHLCFRVQSLESYEQHKIDFSNFGQMLIESEVNGRMIATYKLSEPVVFGNYQIDLVELPAPKAGKKTIEGFEHVEVVIDEPFEKLMSQYSYMDLDTGGLKKAFNQELEIEMEGCALKFHPLSLESVIGLEKNQKVHQALMSSKVLEVLRAFHPLVTGTFPLGLQVKDSDLDIVLSVADFDSFKVIVEQIFGGWPGFECQESEKAGVPTIVVRFNHQDIPFELFAQKTESMKQNAYRHFQAEEKLLKVFGVSLKDKVMKLRQAGLKTEAAFAEALQLAGDPYAEILKLQGLSEQELSKKIIL